MPRTKPRNQKKAAEVVVHQADSAVAEEQPLPFPQPEVAAVQNQEEKKEEEKNADHSSGPVIKKKRIKKRKNEIDEDEEIFGSVEEELETYRSLKFSKSLLAALRDARNADFDEVESNKFVNK
jgi:hypothetical protein